VARKLALNSQLELFKALRDTANENALNILFPIFAGKAHINHALQFNLEAAKRGTILYPLL